MSINKIYQSRSVIYMRLSVLIFVCVFSISLVFLNQKKPVGFMQGKTENYFRLGAHLGMTGEFKRTDCSTDRPFVFRPPGYVFFIAAIL